MKSLVVRVLLGSAASLLVFMSGSAAAHHSAAMFNDQVELTLTGVVTKFDYLNPHAWLYVDVTEEDGTITEWGFEMGAPPLLRRAGIPPNAWRTGSLV